MTIHELKCWPEYFEALWDGKKTFEIRKDDRGYQVGDYLVQREYDLNSGYSGRVMVMSVTYVLDNPTFVKDGYVVMSVDEVMGWERLDKFEGNMKRFFNVAALEKESRW